MICGCILSTSIEVCFPDSEGSTVCLSGLWEVRQEMRKGLKRGLAAWDPLWILRYLGTQRKVLERDVLGQFWGTALYSSQTFSTRVSATLFGVARGSLLTPLQLSLPSVLLTNLLGLWIKSRLCQGLWGPLPDLAPGLSSPAFLFHAHHIPATLANVLEYPPLLSQGLHTCLYWWTR